MTDPSFYAPQGGDVSRSRRPSFLGRMWAFFYSLRHRPSATFLLLLLFIVGISAVSFQWVMGVLLHTRAEVVVPDLSGKRLEQALDVLSPINLSLAKEGVEFDESSPAGTILRQAPPPGLTVREGKVVRVTISSGGRVVFVPELVGKSLSEAQNLLRAAGMSPGAVTQAFSQAHAQGDVLEQNPPPGELGSRGLMVDLKVSKGVPPDGTLLMPDFTNRPLEAAKAWAEEAGVSIDTVEEVGENLMPGIVLRQNPVPDTELKPDQKVLLTVTKRGAGADRPGVRWVRFQVPPGDDKVRLKVVLRDEAGEKAVFDQVREAGALIEIPVEPEGFARVRIYLGGVLVEERVLE